MTRRRPCRSIRADGPAVGLLRVLAGVLVGLLLCGCVSRGADPSWGAAWPSPGQLGEAAVAAARSPATWAPLAGAAVLAVGDLDEDLSEWAADHQPLFGHAAESRSDDLRSVAKAAWLVTALGAPSDRLVDKAGGLAVGAATLAVEDAITGGIKDLAGRRRPDGSNDQSFTSGHAGTASAAATLARRNLDYMTLPGWLDGSLRVGLHGVAAATGWARVEAERHYATDVLAGNALGHFVAAFLHEAFMTSAVPATVAYRPLGGGGAVTLTVYPGGRARRGR